MMSPTDRISWEEVVRVLTPMCAHLSSPKGPEPAPWGAAKASAAPAPAAKAPVKVKAEAKVVAAKIVAAKPESPGVTPAPIANGEDAAFIKPSSLVTESARAIAAVTRDNLKMVWTEATRPSKTAPPPAEATPPPAAEPEVRPL